MRDKEEYRERTYRQFLAPAGLVTFRVAVKETDLFIGASKNLYAKAHQSVVLYRRQIESYILMRPSFLASLSPLAPDELAPAIVREMLRASSAVSVGPMAAVAGAIAEYVGRDLREEAAEVIVENGGDIYLDCRRPVKVGIFAGPSSLSNKIALVIKPEQMPLGVCTSSATVGPSLSFGSADAACVLASSAALADAAASAVGNFVQSEKDIKPALKMAQRMTGVVGVLIIVGGTVGAWGDVTLA